MRFARLLLRLTVLLCVYMLVLLAVVFPKILFLYGLLALLRVRNRRARLDAYGTSRWAETPDLRGLLDE